MPDWDFIGSLAAIVGHHHVHTDARRTEWYRTGFRSGEGEAEAVVIPGTLVELWETLQACVAAGKIVIMQAADTGLTEGSAPNGSYDRDVVVINTLRLNKLHILGGGRQIVSHAGSTLYALERLLKPLGRQPHSVIGSIGSSCIGASVVGGVCNNSGGFIQRGPSFTELSFLLGSTPIELWSLSITWASIWVTRLRRSWAGWSVAILPKAMWTTAQVGLPTVSIMHMSAMSRRPARPAIK